MGFFNFLWSNKDSERQEKKPTSSSAPSLWQRIQSLFTGGDPIDEDLLEQLEEILITSDVGPQTTEEIIDAVEEELPAHYTFAELQALLKKKIAEKLQKVHTEPVRIQAKPHIVLVVGVNGVGKTTTLGKLAYHYAQQGKRVLLSAADTFRAAAPEQLGAWAAKADVTLVSKGMGRDPSSVVYETIQKAQADKADIVLIDTAGRLHTKVPLMNQLQKMKRVIEKLDPTGPHEILLVIDGTTGQNGWQQAQLFKEAIGLTGLVITKLDSLAKGGLLIGLTTQLQVPVRYLGFGEKIEDLSPFDVDTFLDKFFGDSTSA